MIVKGTKIEVIASSIKEKGATVRKGSQGYCRMYTSSFSIPGISAILIPAYIEFVRFGFEKKQRHESKPVCIVIPTINFSDVGDKRKHLNKLIHNLKDAGVSINTKVERHFRTSALRVNKKPVPSVPLVVIKPVLTKEGAMNNFNEFEAWFRCVMVGSYSHSLYVTSEPKNELINRRELLLSGISVSQAEMRSFVGKKKYYKKAVDHLYRDKSSRMRFIKNVNQLNSLLLREQLYKNTNSLMRGWAPMNGIFDIALFFSLNGLCKKAEDINDYADSKNYPALYNPILNTIRWVLSFSKI